MTFPRGRLILNKEAFLVETFCLLTLPQTTVWSAPAQSDVILISTQGLSLSLGLPSIDCLTRVTLYQLTWFWLMSYKTALQNTDWNLKTSSLVIITIFVSLWATVIEIYCQTADGFKAELEFDSMYILTLLLLSGITFISTFLEFLVNIFTFLLLLKGAWRTVLVMISFFSASRNFWIYVIGKTSEFWSTLDSE